MVRARVYVCGGPPNLQGQPAVCGSLYIRAYDSLSCLLFHFGVAGDNWTSGYHKNATSISFYTSGLASGRTTSVARHEENRISVYLDLFDDQDDTPLSEEELR